jgi:hypothetical protein
MSILPAFLQRRFRGQVQPGTSGWAAPPLPAVPTLQDDAFHFPLYAGSPHAFWYTEWWYFNFMDEASGISGLMTIACFDPANHAHLGEGMLTLALFDGPFGKLSPVIEYYPIAELQADASRPQVTLAGRSTITAIDDTTFTVKSAAKDGSLSIDLTYKSADDPVFLARNISGEGWDISSWLSFMPCARVTGTISCQGRQVALQGARGYHDHDWGMWHEFAQTWSWAAFGSPDKEVGFDFGLHAAFQTSIAYLRVGTTREMIKDGSFTFTQSDWKRWAMFWKYPRRMSYEGTTESGRYKVTLHWVVRDTVALWKQALIVFEQSAYFTGEVRSVVDGKLVASIDEPGFCEYTGRWY